MRFVDLSAPITSDPPDTPDALRTEIEFAAHEQGARDIEGMLGVRPELLRDREGWAVETFLRFGTHNSTHVDAPWHYNSIVEGAIAKTIDELPLEWFHAPGVVLDFTAKADGDAITTKEIQTELDRTGHELAPLDIVLVRTGRDAAYGRLEYMGLGPGVTADATRWLHGRGVRVMGIDAWGWDRPLWMQAEDAKAAGEPGIFWAAHQVDLSYSQIERLVNLDQLPPTGFTVSCFPLRLVGGSAAPARVVALLP
jgi:kynurenine formamidase